MPEQPVVAVRGEVVLEVQPEVARLVVTVVARDSDRRKVVRLMNERGGAVAEVLASFRDAVEKIETSSVQVSPQLKYHHRPKERVAGYVGMVRHKVTVTGFDRLGDLVGGLADQELTEVAGPWWALRPDSAVYRRARTEAARDAVRRARDYARALGSEVTGLIELADAELLSDGARPMAVAGATRSLRRRQEVEPEELTIDLEPAKQVIRATVEARFRITEPDLTQMDGEVGDTA